MQKYIKARKGTSFSFTERRFSPVNKADAGLRNVFGCNTALRRAVIKTRRRVRRNLSARFIRPTGCRHLIFLRHVSSSYCLPTRISFLFEGQLITRFEFRSFPSWNNNLFLRRRVDSRTFSSFYHREGTEPHQGHFSTFLQSLDHRCGKCIQRLLAIGFCQSRLSSHCTDKFCFIHNGRINKLCYTIVITSTKSGIYKNRVIFLNIK